MPGYKKRACKFAVSITPGFILLGTENYLKKWKIYTTHCPTRELYLNLLANQTVYITI